MVWGQWEKGAFLEGQVVWAGAFECCLPHFICYCCLQGCFDLILLHCVKRRELGDLFFSFFGVSWVFPYLIRQDLEKGKRSYVGKKRKEVRRAGLLCLFWTVWNISNKIALKIRSCPSKI